MAVLFRINAQSEAFEEALTARGISYVVRGAARFFERQEVRQALALMRGEVRAGAAASDGLRRPGARPCSPAWAGRPRRPRPADRHATAGSRCRRWSPRRPTHATPRPRPAPTLAGFVAELDRRAHEQHAPVAEGVTLATLHAAKGLEWDAVFLCGMQEGSMPITYADTPAAVEEERRLLYVGITRARVHLWVSWSLARNPGGQARRSPSRFLAGLRPESATDRARRRTGARQRRSRGKKAAVCKQCQKPLASSRERNRGYCADCPVPYDEELFELLRSWRKEQADAQSVPAFVVFSDATLEALAEVKPTGPAGPAVDQRHRQGQAREVRRRAARAHA